MVFARSFARDHSVVAWAIVDKRKALKSKDHFGWGNAFQIFPKERHALQVLNAADDQLADVVRVVISLDKKVEL